MQYIFTFFSRTKWASPRQLPYPSILRNLDTLLRRMFPRASVRIKFLFHRKGIFFITSQRQGLSYEIKSHSACRINNPADSVAKKDFSEKSTARYQPGFRLFYSLHIASPVT